MHEQLPHSHTLSLPPSYFTSPEARERMRSSKQDLVGKLHRLHMSSVFDYRDKPVSNEFKKNIVNILEHVPEGRNGSNLALSEPYYYDWLVHANDLEDHDLNDKSQKQRMMLPYPDLAALDERGFEILQNSIAKEHGNENIFRALALLRKSGIQTTSEWFGLKLADKKEVLAYVGSGSGNEKTEEQILDNEYMRSMFRVTRESTKNVLEEHFISKYYADLQSKYEKSIWLSANTRSTRGAGQFMRSDKDIYDFEDRRDVAIARHTVNALVHILFQRDLIHMKVDDKIDMYSLLRHSPNDESSSDSGLTVKNLETIFGEHNFASTDFSNLQNNGLYDELTYIIREALKQEERNPGSHYKEIATIFDASKESNTSLGNLEEEFEDLNQTLVNQIHENYFTKEITIKPEIEDLSIKLTSIFFSGDRRMIGAYFSHHKELFEVLDTIAQNMRNALATLFSEFKTLTDSQRIPYWKVLFFRYERSAYLQQKMQQDIYSALSERANQLGLLDEEEPVE